MSPDDAPREDGFASTDVTSGLAKIFARAKARALLGGQVAAAWGATLLLMGGLSTLGVPSASVGGWELAAGFLELVAAGFAVSNLPMAPVVAGVVVVLDLLVVGACLPSVLSEDSILAQVLAGVRVVGAPFAIYGLFLGYLGIADVKAFQEGFRGRDEWRAAVNPRMSKLVVVGAWAVSLFAGAVFWKNEFLAALREKPAAVAIEEDRKGRAEPAKGFLVAASGDAEDGSGGDGEGEDEDSEDDPAEGAETPESAIPIESLEELDPLAARTAREGMEQGARTDQPGCVLAGLRRHDRCRDDRCRKFARIFLRACLPKSSAKEGFCEGVPPPLRELEGERWSAKLCAGRVSEHCREFYLGVQGHCHPPVRRAVR